MLFASNSLPIRHLDGFCTKVPSILSNRGASGIDGIVHTAAGAAIGSVGRCTLLVGDLATLHDLNALATLKQAAVSIVVVILNNEGGGIFHHLPIASHKDIYSPYFDTPHTHKFGDVCRGFGLSYSAAADRATFAEAFQRARREGGPHVIEVSTDKEAGHQETLKLRATVRGVASSLAQAVNSL